MSALRTRPTILIVDDDAAIRNMIVEVLTLEGYPIETATNGQEALQRLSEGAPRVVLLDLLMPVMDGRATLAALEREPERRQRHQIILVSAMHNLEGARDLQVDGQLPKPFTVEQLLNTLAPYIAKVS
ncbi:MAG TPA: response regulator [Ktedonobacterales bacterium]|jgi:two-component system phosphate regulon response regulator PhoB